MNQSFANNRINRKTRFFFVIVIAIGVFFRFVYLDQKNLTGDECITQVRAAGYKGESYGVEAYQGPSVFQLTPRDQVISGEAISQFQRVHQYPSFTDTIRANATGAPQHPPLYWVFIRFWMQVFGNSTNAIRMLSVIFSLLTIPVLYRLCRELFQQEIIAWLAVSFISVSPVHLFQAHNARPYSLWILMILLSSLALLKALKDHHNQKRSWLLYGITASLSLYTYLFSTFVLIAHGIYVFIREGFHQTQTLKNYIRTLLGVILVFLPWIIVVLFNLKTADKMTAWTGKPVDSLTDLIWSYVNNFANIFMVWNTGLESVLPLNHDSFVFSFGTAITLLSIYSFWFLRQHSANKEWIFIFALTGTIVLSLITIDLLMGGRRAAIGRYLYPSILGIQISVSYVLGMKFHQSIPWKVMTIALILCGILSCAVSVKSQTWKGHPNFEIQSAQIINQAKNPLVISDGDIVFGLMPLNSQLKSTINWIIVSQQDNVVIPNQFSDIFLYKASSQLQEHLTERYQLEPVYQYSYPGSFIWKARSPSILWRLDKK